MHLLRINGRLVGRARCSARPRRALRPARFELLEVVAINLPPSHLPNLERFGQAFDKTAVAIRLAEELPHLDPAILDRCQALIEACVRSVA